MFRMIFENNASKYPHQNYQGGTQEASATDKCCMLEYSALFSENFIR